jgi:transcription antitermination factor NusG
VQRSDLNQWFAIRVKSNRDQVVSTALLGRGYETFLPTYKDTRPSARHSEKMRLLLPGYVFCRLDILHRLPILVIPGVVRIVGIGSIPHPISDEEVESLRQVAKSGLPIKPIKYFASGERVRIEAGPLTGAVGTVVDSKRGLFVVSIHFLQRSVSVLLPAGWLCSSTCAAGRIEGDRDNSAYLQEEIR